MCNAVLSAVLTVVGLVMCVPQLVRLARTRSAAGLSVISMLAGSVSYAAWCARFALERDAAAFVATGVPALVWWVTAAWTCRLAVVLPSWPRRC